MDESHTKTISKQDFARTLKELRLGVGAEDIEKLAKMFDTAKNETANYEEFLTTVVGQINEPRKQVVDTAFKKLDTTGKGEIPLEIVKDSYLADRHPDVIAKSKTEGEIISEFIDTFEQHYSLYVNYL